MIKTVLIVLCSIIGLFILMIAIVVGYLLYLSCISPDNCKCCRGRELGECSTCRVYKNKVKIGLEE